MAGRGRGLTLPAWMTSGGLQPIAPSTDPAPVLADKPAPPTQERKPDLAPQSVPNGATSVGSGMPPRAQSISAPNFQTMHQAPLAMLGTNVAFQPNGFPGHLQGSGFQPGMHMQNAPAFAPPTFVPPSMGGGFPGMPFGGPAGLPQQVPPSMPVGTGIGRGFVPPPAPPMPRLPAGAAPAAIDPNNDVSCWAEHESEAGLKYWYNRVTLVSTYDKPFCLKTPEERAIPPCAWKEYTAADGKKYYSNGKESTWIMPEEYRVWKERMDAVEQKRAQQAAAQAAAEAERIANIRSGKKGSGNTSSAGAAGAAGASSASQAPGGDGAGDGGGSGVIYASAAEAAEAFKELLADMKISTIAKMKEVQDLCAADPRWDALKTQGEKKQALAEYQTKRLKLEKEQQKLKARKQRDAFLLMLAENTDIDARTRWKDAVALLQDDPRYKNIEDARDREDLFQEFVVELEKKEREDKRRARDEATSAFARLLKEFAAEGKVSRKSIWADSKREFADVLVRPEFRSLEEADFRRAFQSHVAEMEEEFQASERRRRAEHERSVAACQAELRGVLEEMGRNGQLTAESRWKDCTEHETLSKSAAMEKLQALFPSAEDRGSSGFISACRSVFEAVQAKVYEQYKMDKRLVKDLLSKHNFKVRHDTSFADFKAFAMKLAGVREAEEGRVDSGKLVVEAVAAVAARSEEDGEEVDEAPFEQLRTMMLERPTALAQVFGELHKKAVADHEEEVYWAHKVEKKFNSVLAENFYLPEHASIPWDDAKKALQRRSVYDELSKSERRRLFAEHMAALASGAKLPAAVAAAAEGGAAEGPRVKAEGDRDRTGRSDVEEDRRRDDSRRGDDRRHRSSRSRSARPAARENSQVRRGEGREVRDVSKDRNRRSSRDRGSSRGRDSHKDRDRARESESRTRVRDERDPRGDEDRRKRARGDEEGPQ